MDLTAKDCAVDTGETPITVAVMVGIKGIVYKSFCVKRGEQGRADIIAQHFTSPEGAGH